MIPKAKALLGTRRRVALAAGLALLAALALGVAVASATAPSVTTDDASSVAYTTAHASGTVDPTDQDTTFHFEYATQADFSDATSTPDQGPLSAGSGSQSVSADLAGLAPNTTYHLRLVATNVDGTTSVEAPDTFTTLAVTPPTAAIDPVSGVTSSAAHFSGTVDPQGSDPAFDATWHFEFSTNDSTWTPLPDQGPVSGSGAQAVAEDATGLEPNKHYFVRLVASNLGGQTISPGPDPEFTTVPAPPDATTGSATLSNGGAIAELFGTVNPNNSPTVYWFEYGAADCAANPCTSVPASQDASAGSSGDPVSVSRFIGSLQPGTTYHYRLLAANAQGTTPGLDQTFVTPASGGGPGPQGPCPNDQFRTGPSANLPDCRAYEQASPPDKNGADVMGDSSRVRVAGDGSAASFTSLSGFDDVRGMGIATEYLSERSSDPNPGTNGWGTHAINPPQQPETFFGGLQGLDSGWVGDFSSDLSAGVFRSPSPVTDEDPNVANVMNLYLRDDLRTPGAGHFRLVTPCPVCASPLGPFSILQRPELVGASADFSHILFESTLTLTSDVGGSPNLYEWTDGTLRPVGVLPDSACGTPPCLAGGSSVGGNLAVGSHAISTDGSRIVFGDVSSGQLYQRIDGNHTVAVSASERTDCADHDPCNGTPEPDPGGTQPATYQMASADGMRVFFTSAEQLTNDDTNSVVDLYMWDATRPAGSRLTDLSLDRNPTDVPGNVIGMFGAGDSGRDAYFAASGQIVAGKPSVQTGIYAWHDGGTPPVTYVGKMGSPGPDSSRDFLGQGFPGQRVSRVSPDGQHLFFMSHSGVGLLSAHGGVDFNQGSCGGPTIGCAEFYVYDAASDSLQCASCSPDGTVPTSDAETWLRTGTGAATTTTHLTHTLSDDGRWVFFDSSEALVPQDSNGRVDAYEFDTQTGNVSLLSSGTDPADSFFMDASGSGRDAFILTREQLVGWDDDSSYDLYDARADGGFPEPPHAALPCGDPAGCQGPGSGPPGIPGSGSSALSGPGNQGQSHGSAAPTRPRCKKHHHKKRCKKKSNKSSARSANPTRGDAK